MSTIKLAIQKSGRLHDESLKLLRDCGIDVNNGKDQLKVSVSNYPMEILYLRNSDIPNYLENGVADVGIIGENQIVESGSQIRQIEKLGFSKCRLSIAVPKQNNYASVNDLQGTRIATSYPNTLGNFLDKNGIKASIHRISGSVEIAPNIGLANAICDLVSSGSTLFKNGLKECEVILDSEAVLAANRELADEKLKLLNGLTFRIKSVLRAKRSKYVLMNVPNNQIEKVSQILPVLRSPTVMPLAEAGWSSVHSVIDENKFWDIIDKLKSVGAEGILIIPIDKMVL